MKLNWFSPLPPAPTDIAHYTARVLPALAARADITLWTDQKRWDDACEKYAAVRRYSPDEPDWREINRAALNFYHLGNNPHFHHSIWRVSRRHPGVVVLHDTRLQHFFAGVFRERQNNPGAYIAEMKKYYGPDGERAARNFMSGADTDIEKLSVRFPLTDLALENAFGVLVHTHRAFADLRRENKRLVAYAPLPYPAAAPVTTSPPAPAAPPPLRLIIFGYLGVNRRLASVLEALAQFPDRKVFHLDIYGHLWDETKVRAMIDSLKLNDSVSLHGFVPERELDEALDAAHLAFNLRFPTMGEASGSQLRIWSHALPSIVSATGWYADLSAEVVAHVRPEHEAEDLQKHLRGFLSAPEIYRAMGRRGKQLLEAEHGPGVYAQTILELAERAGDAQMRGLTNYYLRRAAEEIAAWETSDELTSDYRRLAEEIDALTK
ncbi:MAG TPA: glycosyltransferase [Pyrinomonadaceae bacterium]|jgi:glycosyltransferase involved in cell wall biosynthesis|nr:glycosyltransferase [Pyrinomonadaceae bacterium]